MRVDPDHRHQLVGADGAPFLMVGDAAWSLIAQLSLGDARRYLTARKARGFNTVLVNLVEHEFASNAPANKAGVAPFAGGSTMARPNDAYFDHAEDVVSLARELGFLVLLTPSYTGYGGAEQGWYQEMKRTGASKLRDYARYVGTRFSDHDNILWVEGGDYDAPDQDLVEAVAEGIAETDPGALQTFNGARGSTVADSWGDRPWFTVDNIYTDQFPLKAAQDAYAKANRPFFLIEGYYENEHDLTQVDLRRQGYETVLAGGIGQVFGNNPMWHFDAEGLFPAPGTWQQQLSSPGTAGVQHLAGLFTALPWWNLRPDDGGLLRGGTGGDDPPVAAVSCDQRVAVVYDPRGSALQLDLSHLRKPLSARWHDPTNGKSTTADLPQSLERLTLKPPGRNAQGASDWVLVVRSG